MMTGGKASALTVTVNWQVLRLVQSSVAVQLTTVRPTGNRLPDGGTQATDGFGSVSSSAFGVGNVTTTPFVEQVQTRRLVGHWMEGGVLSAFTVTRNWQVCRLPQLSVAVQVTE